jgi:hypothetical protein
MLVLSAKSVPADASLVGAGIGEAVLREVARRLGRDYIGFDSFISVAPAARMAALQCGPAALALIAARLEQTS